MTDQPGGRLGWHVIPGSLLLESLHRVKLGEDPDVVFAELWANADHEDYRRHEGDR